MQLHTAYRLQENGHTLKAAIVYIELLDICKSITDNSIENRRFISNISTNCGVIWYAAIKNKSLLFEVLQKFNTIDEVYHYIIDTLHVTDDYSDNLVGFGELLNFLYNEKHYSEIICDEMLSRKSTLFELNKDDFSNDNIYLYGKYDTQTVDSNVKNLITKYNNNYHILSKPFIYYTFTQCYRLTDDKQTAEIMAKNMNDGIDNFKKNKDSEKELHIDESGVKFHSSVEIPAEFCRTAEFNFTFKYIL
ncbi:unnamed protein product [Didymodactylos carnosus]|uniref:Uncharacterized protein n=1 Tax=Didymodactylos carnosus TaxID=1234261 RepID=A0A814VXE4_9BILA|nr:unnamed protein product [Didymodactylos carnosus]CAF1194572.1 unnamed protein product [Didymodactylos carnosus]CAF3682483.1 unnamed protein product [Didymodactylos carnosus]CAF3958891.1 unnamed protein product [Didymodactylos carnosus]